MFTTRIGSLRTLTMVFSIMSLFVCMGSGPMHDDGGCDEDLDLFFGAGDVTPTGTGGPADPTTTPTTPTAPEITIGANASEVDSGTDVTYVVTITGGTPPYYVYWFQEGDSAWSLGNTSSTRKVEGSAGQTRLMYCQVADANNLYSNQATASVTIRTQTDRCPSVAGRYNTIQGWVRILDFGNGLFAGYYGTGTGDQTIILGDLDSGSITQGATGCPDCVTLSGRWSDDVNAGEYQFIFSAGLKTFNGKWSYDGDSHWQASAWDGYRDTCN